MNQKFISAMEKVAMKLISMWQIDLALGIAGVVIFYLVQRWREKEEKKKKVGMNPHTPLSPDCEQISRSVQELEDLPQDGENGGVGVSPTNGKRRVRELPPDEV
jgi:hypothetical protein